MTDIFIAIAVTMSRGIGNLRHAFENSAPVESYAGVAERCNL
jgi:hypothetical protein